jgi:hypothetical protein
MKFIPKIFIPTNFNITHVLNSTVIIINMKDENMRFNENFN